MMEFLTPIIFKLTQLVRHYLFGGADFVSSLIKKGLIDEYHLIVNPTTMGEGMTIFNSLDIIQKFEPTQSKLYPGGKTVLSFKPKKD